MPEAGTLRPTVFVALPWERKAILRSLSASDRILGRTPPAWRVGNDANCVEVVQTGIGQSAAGRAAQAIGRAANPWIALGCCGGLDPSLRSGDLAIATTIIGDDGSYACDESWIARLETSAASLGSRVAVASFLSVDRPLLASAAKAAEFRRSGAAVVEMEGAALAAEARRRGVAFASVRVVLDDASTDLAPGEGEVAVAFESLPLVAVGEKMSALAKRIFEDVAAAGRGSR